MYSRFWLPVLCLDEDGGHNADREMKFIVMDGNFWISSAFPQNIIEQGKKDWLV